MAIVSSLPLLAQGRTLGSLAYLQSRTCLKLQPYLIYFCFCCSFRLVYMMMGILFLSLRSCEADRRRLHRLRCSVKDYAWGKIGGWIHSCKESTRRIPMDRSIRQDRTRSFGWGLTSYLEDDADGVTLRSWIAENPEALGEMGLPSPVSLQGTLLKISAFFFFRIWRVEFLTVVMSHLNDNYAAMKSCMFLSSRGYKNLIRISIISLHTTIMDEDKANSKTPNIS
ncbi:unnamed protein product [Brassica oleracea var. botrytis]